MLPSHRQWMLLGFAVLLISCGSDTSNSPSDASVASLDPDAGEAQTTDNGTPPEDTAEEDIVPVDRKPLPASEQRSGDPSLGFEVLGNYGYVGCGIPKKLIDMAIAAGVGFGGPPLPGRDSALPYYLTSFTTAKGVELVSPNCFTCHAEVIDNKVMIGVGSTTTDYGGLATQITQFKGLIGLAKNLVTEDELAELQKFVDRLTIIAPYVQPLTQGPSPADNLAAILFAHRDPETLAWSDEPLLEPPPTLVVPVDVPPWWRMQKKHTMFYSAAGRGDHAKIMTTASTLCVDTVEEAATIDSWFPDVRSYLLTLEAPPWPYALNDELAQTGQEVFTEHCALCHGTYDKGAHTYPNVLVDINVVGTDTVLAIGASQFVDRFVDWFNNSFYGKGAWLEPEMGYVAPPLDGIWVTAPYLHNGSVPSLLALLNSNLRPKFWRRQYNDGYDQAVMGWASTALEEGHDANKNPALQRSIYDTTNLGYSNEGHTFGDALSSKDRSALMEYLKTL